MIAELTHKRTFISVNGFDVHLQAVAAGGSVAALLTHKQFLSAMFRSFMQTQLSAGQETLGAQRTCMWFGSSMDFNHVDLEVSLLHELLRARRALIGHHSCVHDCVMTQLLPLFKGHGTF